MYSKTTVVEQMDKAGDSAEPWIQKSGTDSLEFRSHWTAPVGEGKEDFHKNMSITYRFLNLPESGRQSP